MSINPNASSSTRVTPRVNPTVSPTVNPGGGSTTVQVQPRPSQESEVETGAQASNAPQHASSQSIAEANRIAAARAAEQARIREERRNEQLRREKDAANARNAREAQSSREVPDAMAAARQAANPVSQASSEKKTSSNLSPRVVPMSASDVASAVESGSEANETPTKTDVNGLMVDVSTGEVFDASQAAPSREVPVMEQSEPRSSATKEQARGTRRDADAQAKASARVLPNNMSDILLGNDVVEMPLQQQVPRRTSANEATDGSSSYGDRYKELLHDYMPTEAEEDIDIGPFDPNDKLYRLYQDIDSANGDQSKEAEILRGYEAKRHGIDIRESIQIDQRYRSTNFDAQDHKMNDIEFRFGESESRFMSKLRRAQNKIIQRFLNPSLLRIESEYVQEKKFVDSDGKERTYGRLRYSDYVETAIGSVRKMYNCSIYNVMQLIQLRAGLGVSADGKIAHIDPNEFHLTDDQVVELCRDIVASQQRNGHPLGSVSGKPGGNGVRDDTGRFVVVAKTRCFPLGYIPNQLKADLKRDSNSPFYGLTDDVIDTMVGEEWINVTYPQLCANTGGNLMFQARAIENMMRGLMAIDGANPLALDIPSVVQRQTLMELRAERASIDDPDLRAALDVKERNMDKALSQYVHRYRKTNGSRSADGSIDSAASRRRNGAGDAFRELSSLQRAAKAANIGIMISNVPEAIVADKEQSLANVLSDAVFNRMHKGLKDRYAFTDTLRNVAESQEAIEAHEVAEALYRIGGHMALDAFFAEKDGAGYARNRLTKQDLRHFLQDVGVTGPNGSVSDQVRESFGIKPGQEKGFLANAAQIIGNLDNNMLGSGMFVEQESRQFVKMSMSEMARAYVHGRESYDASQVEGWAMNSGEEMVRSLLQTDAGREAFMTQGITSLGRKSPIEHQMRLIMNKNGLTEFAVRTMFDRFPEYGVNKILQAIPFSNTLSYLGALGIGSVGDILTTANTDTLGGRSIVNAGEALQRGALYQAGTRTSFWEGLRKNLLYDSIMAGEKLAIAGLYCGYIMAMGGVQPPDDDKKDRYTWSEWKIGSGEDAVPLKWAWWMDDLSGVGLPLGMSWAICIDGNWSDEAKKTATNTFINAIANFNSGTALFDAIDLVNNFDEEVDRALGKDTGWYHPADSNEFWSTTLEQGFWDLVGDMTPTAIGQLTPWSKDYIFKGDADAHTASKVYDTDKYSMEDAEQDYHTKQTGSYADYMRRRSAQTNVLQAMFYDWVFGAGSEDSAITGYKYTEQPLDTMVDQYVQAMYDRFFLDLDPSTSEIPLDQEEREAELDARAAEVVQWIDEHYENATQANLDGFVLNYEARVNCINYCYKQIDAAWDVYNEQTETWLPDQEYEQVVQDRQDKIDHYKNLIYNYFQSEDIPWSLPRYVRQESDTETRYVDKDGNAMTYLDTLGPDAKAHVETYWYGNRPGLLPVSQPRTEGKGYNFETIPYWAVTDKDGNPVSDLGVQYDNAGNLVVNTGYNAGKNVRESMWGGQGNNMGVQVDKDGNPVLDKDGNMIPIPLDEELHIERGGVPTLGDNGRPWRIMTERFPESLKNLDADTVSKLLGIPSSLPTDEEEEDDTSTSGGGRRRSSGGGGRRYTYGGGGGGGGGYSSSYNPRIYSNARQVYSTRASGMSTRSPYRATTTYLRPSFYTSGSRRAYSRLS